ncbi:MAG: hypothetical protein JXA11_08065 [Phycisphaerae bacterium]|nr:hypothetical protein [Phycisphaerae bacterium]
MIFLTLLLLVVYSFACLSLGLVLLRCFVGREMLQSLPVPSARVMSGFLLGGGVLANVWLLVSLLPGKWFRLPVVGSLLLVSAVVGAVPAARALGSVVRQFILSFKAICRSHWFWAALAAAALAFPVLYALAAALPPRSDAAAWYFALPKLLAHEGSLRPLPGYEFFSQIGLHGELHAAALMLLGDPRAATMFAGFLGVAAVMLLIEIARQAGVGRHGRWTLFLLAYTSTAFIFLTFAGRLDLFGIAMSLAAVYWALRTNPRPGVLILVGVLGCFGVVAKATYALTTVPMLAILLLWRTWLRADKGHRLFAVLRVWGWCLLGAVIAVIPHAVKNIVLYGPEYILAPFFVPATGHDWSGSRILTDAQAARVLWTYPVSIFLGQFPGMFGSINAAVLALWPLTLLLPRPKRFLDSTLVQLTLVGFLGVTIFILLQTWNFSLRYFMPALLLLLLAPAAAVDFVWNSSRIRVALKIGVAVVLVMAAAERFNRTKGHPGDGLKYILGQVNALEVSESSARMCQAVNDRARPGDRVFLATKYPYFLKPELIASAAGSDERRAVERQPTPADRWRKCYTDGFRFLCIGYQGGKLDAKRRQFKIYKGYGWLCSKDLPDELELICRYWGPEQPRPNDYAVFELRSANHGAHKE